MSPISLIEALILPNLSICKCVIMSAFNQNQ